MLDKLSSTWLNEAVWFLLQQAKVTALDTDTHEGNTLKQVKAILSKAEMLTTAFAQQASLSWLTTSFLLLKSLLIYQVSTDNHHF